MAAQWRPLWTIPSRWWSHWAGPWPAQMSDPHRTDPLVIPDKVVRIPGYEFPELYVVIGPDEPEEEDDD